MKGVHVPMFRVWEPTNQTEDYATGRWEYGAHDVPSAARVHANYRHEPDELGDATWPITFRVRDIDNDKVYDVVVHREIRFEFRAEPPKEIT